MRLFSPFVCAFLLLAASPARADFSADAEAWIAFSKAWAERIPALSLRALGIGTATLPRATRLMLAEHVPALFAPRFACGFKGDSSREPVLPGDTLEAPQGGQLLCPEGIEAKLEPGARVRVLQFSMLPAIELLEGSVSVSFPKAHWASVLGGHVVMWAGLSDRQEVSLRGVADKKEVHCARGNVMGEIDFDPAGAGLHFSSESCQVAVSRMVPRRLVYVLGGEVLPPEHFSLARKYWPKASSSKALSLVQDGAKLKWAMGVEAKLSCSLFGQAADGEPASTLTKLELVTATGEFPVPSGAEKSVLWLACQSAAEFVASSPAVPAP